MPSANFTKAANESRQLKAKPSNDELLEVSLKFLRTCGVQITSTKSGSCNVTGDDVPERELLDITACKDIHGTRARCGKDPGMVIFFDGSRDPTPLF
jgi:hypothetical protein